MIDSGSPANAVIINCWLPHGKDVKEPFDKRLRSCCEASPNWAKDSRLCKALPPLHIKWKIDINVLYMYLKIGKYQGNLGASLGV